MGEQIRVGRSDDFVSGEARQVDLGETAIAVVRIGDTIHAVADRCSHANYNLSEGEVDCDEATLECWKHGAQFSLATGEPLTLPATKPVTVYTVDVVDDDVFVTLPEEAS